MLSLCFIIRDPEGLHARPAAKIAMCALKQRCRCTVLCGGHSADATQLMQLMALPARCGDELTVVCDGPGEAEARAALEAVLAAEL